MVNGNGLLVNSQDQMGGWPVILGASYPQDTDGNGIPNEWETAHGSNPHDPYDASSYTIRAPSGYTWIEEYINSLFQVQ